MPKFCILLALLAFLFVGCGSYEEVNSFFAGECGKSYYDVDKQFCQNAQIYDKCGGFSYDLLTQKCENNVLFSKCGGGWYNPIFEFCSGNSGVIIESKGEFIDGRDNRIYRYVTIGTQMWMAENLRYETLNTKCYGDDPDNCKIFGILYDWNTAKTVCPSGWHLPNDTEWFTLRHFATDVKLMANSALWVLSPKGTDDYGFTALPGGYYRSYRDGSDFLNINEIAIFWSATAGSYAGSAHVHILTLESGIREIDGVYTDDAWVNVRCIKD